MTAELSIERRAGKPAAPTFGVLLRRLRDARGISRERLAFNAGVSASYVTHLEKGTRSHPTHEVVDAVIRYLDRVEHLSEVERRYVRELAGLSNVGCPPLRELRAAVTPELQRLLDGPHPAAITAVGGHILLRNPGWERAFPGMLESGNQFRWLFTHPLARRVLADWRAATTLSVQAFRLAMGGFGGAAAFADLLDELGRHPEFRRIWAEGTVAAVPPVWRLNLHDLHTGTPRTVLVQTGMLQTGTHPGWLISQFLLPVAA
ncbi:helix-turn-helix domain-containing protein [Nocardia sp. NPDC005978]|uniref:helix-turn-helix domain-containing protein n=1 Tax=unclassified Nocardia TaxID=2637762 RepID=UPI0033A152EE